MMTEDIRFKPVDITALILKEGRLSLHNPISTSSQSVGEQLSGIHTQMTGILQLLESSVVMLSNQHSSSALSGFLYRVILDAHTVKVLLKSNTAKRQYELNIRDQQLIIDSRVMISINKSEYEDTQIKLVREFFEYLKQVNDDVEAGRTRFFVPVS